MWHVESKRLQLEDQKEYLAVQLFLVRAMRKERGFTVELTAQKHPEVSYCLLVLILKHRHAEFLTGPFA